MTKKEELLQFIDENITEDNELLTHDKIISVEVEHDFLEVGTELTRGFATTKVKLIPLITNNFSDDLVGKLPGDPVTVEILSWEVK